MKRLEDVLRRKVLPIVVGTMIFSTSVKGNCEEKKLSESINIFYENGKKVLESNLLKGLEFIDKKLHEIQTDEATEKYKEDFERSEKEYELECDAFEKELEKRKLEEINYYGINKYLKKISDKVIKKAASSALIPGKMFKKVDEKRMENHISNRKATEERMIKLSMEHKEYEETKKIAEEYRAYHLENKIMLCVDFSKAL